MRVSCDKYLGLRHVDMLQRLGCVVSWVAADVCHQHLYALCLEEVELWEHTTHYAAVDISIHALKWLEGSYFICHLHRAEIARVPYLVAGCKELHKYIIKNTVSVGYYTNFHTFVVLFYANIDKNINFYVANF